MACKTCRREDMPETCGSENGEPCACCGMVIIATAETQDIYNQEREESEGNDSNS